MTVANDVQHGGGEIFRIIPEIMRRVGGVAKSRQNVQQKYAFRGIDDIYNAYQPVMAELGVFIVPEVIDKEFSERESRGGGTLFYTRLKVKHTFYAADGSNVVAVTIGEAMDSGDKSANKAMSAAMKYAMIETFSIPTEEFNDTENQTHEPLPQRQQQAPPAPRPQAPAPPAQVKLATEVQAREVKELLNIVRLEPGTVDKWFAKAGVDVWEDMPAETVQKCIDFLKGRLPGGGEPAHAPVAKPAQQAKPAGPNVSDADWEAFGDALVQRAEIAGEVDRVTAVLTILRKQNPTEDQLSTILTAMEKSEFDWQTGRVTAAQQAA